MDPPSRLIACCHFNLESDTIRMDREPVRKIPLFENTLELSVTHEMSLGVLHFNWRHKYLLSTDTVISILGTNQIRFSWHHFLFLHCKL